MEDDILQVIKEEITDNPTLEEMKASLLDKGYQEKDITDALKRYEHRFGSSRNKEVRRNVRLFGTKEVLDRVGYGFVTHQFINILFYQATIMGGLGQLALFLVGLFNGLKSLLSTVISSVLQEYSKVNDISKRAISRAGIVFGFSFLLMAVGYRMGLWWLFGAALLIGSIGVVSYGDLYNNLLRQNLKKERMGRFLANIGEFGIIITAISLMTSGWLLETFPATGRVVSIMGHDITLIGFVLSFMISTIAFILSGYIVSFIKQRKKELSYPFRQFWSEYHARVKRQRRVFFRNRIILLLLVTSVLLGIAQILGNSYYGIFIYERFHDVLLGGFLNVAVIYTLAVIVSVLGPWVTRGLNRYIGYAPMLVFGTLLIAMMPLVAAWNPNIYALGVAQSLSIIGSAIVGAAQGLLARKLLKEEDRKMYFASLSFMIVFPFIILLPVGAWLTQSLGLTLLFKGLVFLLVGLVVPLYLVLVGFANRSRL